MVSIYELLDEIHNENEETVAEIVYRYQKENLLPCQCRDCLLDITALALTKLKPRYSVSMLKDLYATPQQQQEYLLEVEDAVKDACEKVAQKPHHP